MVGLTASIKNKSDGKTYTISTIKCDKTIKLSEQKFHVIAETAVYEGKVNIAKVSLGIKKPIFVLELIDFFPSSKKGLEEYHTKITKVINESEPSKFLEDISYCDTSFGGEGFFSDIQQLWQVYYRSKVNVIFLCPNYSPFVFDFRKLTDKYFDVNWNAFSYIIDKYITNANNENKIVEQSVSSVGASLGLILVGYANNATRIFANKRNERPINLFNYFETYLVSLLLITDRYVFSTFGGKTITRENYMQAVDEAVITVWENAAKELDFTEDETKEVIRNFIQLYNERSLEYEKYKVVAEEDKGLKGTLVWEANKNCIEALIGDKESIPKSNFWLSSYKSLMNDVGKIAVIFQPKPKR